MRGALTSNPEGGSNLLLRKNAGSDWEEAISWSKEDALTSGPVGFTGNGEGVYPLDSRGANAARLVLFDPENGETDVLVEDPRVKQAEAEQVVAAMREKGIDHEYMLFEDEGHGFARPENRLKFYASAEKFLARFLGGRHEE